MTATAAKHSFGNAKYAFAFRGEQT